MMPLFPFLLGAAATALLTTDSGRKLADRIGAAVTNAAKAKYDEAMAAIEQPKTGNSVSADAEHKDAEKEPENERNA